MTCRWPKKAQYTSRVRAEAAAHALRKSGKAKPGIGAYQCVGHWHVGHSLDRGIKQALGSGKNKFTKRRVW